ncbi:sigma-70 family RNA polymerase sigma factor [Paenibacillus sp. YN15]|uniref:sigma-70 family RNA polymerase sigma factor n=1 Tax=Paenibacillus sp. YN15 TaxID=1742774 RepID=UPI000DCB39F9|nr:sigma-70 family RNA polymerase sigma factor [Paenibacillus sp. YN15]RAU96881.1 hypothetical protein DQG13_20095 [Paenibacillus sp. YN15]
MSNDQQILANVEKGFSRYIHACLFHTSRDFFRRIDRELLCTKPLDEETDGIYLMMNRFSSPIVYAEAQECLLSVIRALNPMERKLLFMKFYEEKTDAEIAQLLGITQQAVSKTKRMLLGKLKSRLEM